MSLVVVLDSGPLGLITSPTASPTNVACNEWVEAQLGNGNRVVVPEIGDYEVRRELIRVERRRGLRKLDGLKLVLEYAPLTTETMLLAAQFWADVRRRGQPTADPHALDGDVILAAQATRLASAGDAVVVATMNPAHLARFVDARAWEDIPLLITRSSNSALYLLPARLPAAGGEGVLVLAVQVEGDGRRGGGALVDGGGDLVGEEPGDVAGGVDAGDGRARLGVDLDVAGVV